MRLSTSTGRKAYALTVLVVQPWANLCRRLRARSIEVGLKKGAAPTVAHEPLSGRFGPLADIGGMDHPVASTSLGT